MSSTVKLNLQPPPNVDFVTGYPGIPPGPDRPQASVKGAIEVRVPTQGVKAKWVRIELRKVETLPEGGPANTFYDFVGPSPVNLWSTSDEYSVLRTQDFPFSIRVPESIPPTVSLDGKAGIGYELVASVCTKGKKGFLRKAKSVVTSTVAPITIDKHELHTTWPIYCQPDIRRLAQDGVVLTAERNHTCYGPGDRITLVATIKSESLTTLILRGFEFFLKETTVYRAGAVAAGKRNAAQSREVIVCESKVPINATLYGGNSHSSELSLMMSPQHTTTTLNAARHIDVTYTLCLRALMGTGATLIMDLPVMISNWQRTVSFDAINRIGHAPSLSLIPAGLGQHIAPVVPIHIERTAQPAAPAATTTTTLPINRDNVYGHARNGSTTAYNTLPALSGVHSSTDELGFGTGLGLNKTTTANGLHDDASSLQPSLTAQTSFTANAQYSSNVGGSSSNTSPPRSTAAGASTARYTPKPQETAQVGGSSRSGPTAVAGTGAGGSSAAPGGKNWITAEEEKLMLYEQARSNVAKTQGAAAAPPPASASVPVTVIPAATSSPSRGPSATAAPAQKTWLSADEEKRLFQQAQEAVQRAQGVSAQPLASSAAAHTRNTSDPKTQTSSGSSSKPSGAALYAQAMSAQNRAGASGSAQAGGSSGVPKTPTTQPVPHYMTAEQEKAALRRYEEAKRAVDRTQNGSEGESVPSNPIAYDALFPAVTGQSTSNPPPPTDALPPSFESAAGGSNIMAQVSEKERLRRAYEAQDAAAAARQTANRSPPPAAYSPPAPAPAPTPAPAPATTPAPSLPGPYADALKEKEALRRKYAARDAARAGSQPVPNPQTPPPPVRSATQDSPATPMRSPGPNSSFRPTPVPPAASPQRVLTAAEEKAMLQAKFDARDNAGRKPSPPAVNGNGPMANTNGAPPPPPLAPRPPVEYIKETQEEDARVSRLNGPMPHLDTALALDFKPFTPFQARFDSPITPPGPPSSFPPS